MPKTIAPYRAQRTRDLLARVREGDRGAVTRHLEYLAEQNPFDKGLRWAAGVTRRELERELHRG